MKRNKCLITAIAVSFLIGSSLTVSMADDLSDKLQNLQEQINESRAQQENWQAVINEIAEKLKAIQLELNEATKKLRSIQNEQAAINEQIKQTEEEIRKAEIYLRQRQNILNKRVRSIYMHGQLSYLEVITGAKSFSDFANRLELLKRIIHSDFNLIQEIQKQKALIEAKKDELQQKKNKLDALAEEAQQAESQIRIKKEEQQQVMNDAKRQKDAAAAMEADLIAESNNVRQLIQARSGSVQAGGTIVHGSGAFIWPCNGPITSPFGYRTHPIFGTTIYHAGIDIGVDYGTPIHAADSGTVILAGWCGGYGNAVIIDHGNGLQTLYGHNTSVAVSEGQAVSQGEVIAYAGSTGYSTGPHCHFEVRENGEAVDPMGYL